MIEDKYYKTLFKHLDGRVMTPRGEGKLVQVFDCRAAVVFDSEPKRLRFFKPEAVKAIDHA